MLRRRNGAGSSGGLRRVLGFAIVVAWGTLVPAEGATTLRYYGGPVISNVKIIQVNWGSTVDATLRAQLPAFYAAIASGPYFDWLNEYSTRGLTGYVDGLPGSEQVIGRGTFGGTYTITPSVAGTSITDAQIQTELAAQIAAANLPAPEFDAHGLTTSVYMIDFPNGITIHRGTSTSCVQYCAYHFTTIIDGHAVSYNVLPFIGAGSPCQGGCGTAPNDLDNEFAVHAHQLAEAVTDTNAGLVFSTTSALGRPLGWYSPNANAGEIGDICNAQQATVNGYTVQKLWSNLSQACIASVPGLAVCDGTATRCRPCYADDEGQPDGCTGGTPYCDVDVLSATFGQCTSAAPTTTTTISSETTTTVLSDTTTTTIPGGPETCGNCIDEDGNGLTDFEEAPCCPQAQTTDMTPRKVALVPHRGTVKLTIATKLPQVGLGDAKPPSQDVFVQLRADGGEVLCARIPAADLKAPKTSVVFQDPHGTVAAAGGLQAVTVHQKKDGSGTLAASGKHLTVTPPAAGSMLLTFALRDPATAEAGNRCGTATLVLRAKKKGALIFP